MFRQGAKVGRNAPCPCGSGKKYKKCHGSLDEGRTSDIPAVMKTLLARAEAAEVQRVRQQGHGMPIISFETNGTRFVAVRNRLMYGKSWKTFHEFLGDYIKMALGPEWGTAEIKKPFAERHPILQWYDMVCAYQQQTIAVPGNVSTAPMIGAVAAYLQLAYDLYALDHNAELQNRLLTRLRNADNFAGARYEVHVAARLIRAGFDLEFENEDDGSTSHCEFTATFRATGKKFSVEAKHSGAGLPRLIRQLRRALEKAANHERVVFIEANMPDDGSTPEPIVMKDALRRLRRFEGSDPAALLLPPAYVFVTNTPWTHHLQGTGFRYAMLGEGFHLPDFKQDTQYPSLRHAIDARDRHKEMHALLASVRDHSNVPSTFDGELPEYAFGEARSEFRLIVGNRYEIEDGEGKKVVGVLTSATVAENESAAYCAFQLPDGRKVISTAHLSEPELAAWRRHPDTFFGVVGQRTTKVRDLLDLYDFLLASLQKTPRERVLEFLAAAPDLAQLRNLDQSTLISVYAERMASSMWQRSQESAPAAG